MGLTYFVYTNYLQNWEKAGRMQLLLILFITQYFLSGLAQEKELLYQVLKNQTCQMLLVTDTSLTAV